jgi:hypothetical protein
MRLVDSARISVIAMPVVSPVAVDVYDAHPPQFLAGVRASVLIDNRQLSGKTSKHNGVRLACRSSQQAALVIPTLHCEDIRVAQSSALNVPPAMQSHASTPSRNDVLRERRLNFRLHLAATRLQQTTGAAGVAIALTDDGTTLVCRAAAGSLLEDVGRRISLSHGLAAECLISGRLQWSGNAVWDHRVDDALSRELGIRSIALLPVLVGDALVGILQFLYRQPYAFGARELIRLEDLAQTVAAQITRAHRTFSDHLYLGDAKSRSVPPYASIILIAAFLLFTLILIRPTYIARYVGTSSSSVERPVRSTWLLASPASKVLWNGYCWWMLENASPIAIYNPVPLLPCAPGEWRGTPK